MKKVTTIIFLLTMLLTFGFVFSANADDEADSEQAIEQSKKQWESQREKIKKEVEQKREQIKTTQEQKREQLKTASEQKREQMKTERKQTLENLKAEREKLKEQFKEKFAQEKCQKIQAQIQAKNENFGRSKEKHTSVYANVIARVNKFITRFDEAGLSTTEVKAHLEILQGKIDQFKTDYSTYASKISEVKGSTCERSEGEFKGGLLETKTLLKNVKADANDIRTYMRETILSDLKALKTQMPKEDENESEDQKDN